MLFGRTIEKYVATSIITYKLISYGDVKYSIAKCDLQHDKINWICRNINNKDAVLLIWEDVKRGIQK